MKKVMNRSRTKNLLGVLAVTLTASIAQPAISAGVEGVTSFATAPVPATPSSINTTVAAPCQIGAPANYTCGANITVDFGVSGGIGDRQLTGFSTGSTNYSARDVVDFVRIRRNDNVSAAGERQIIFFESPSTGNNKISTTTVSTMEEALRSKFINRGSDNLFSNNIETNGNSNNIERVDFIIQDGVMFPDSLDKIGFLVIERGGNDQFKIAAITAIDSNGTPTAFGSVVNVATSNWGTGTAFQQKTTVLRREATETLFHPSAQTDAQPVKGVYVSYATLGIVSNQSVYGYAIFPNDIASVPSSSLIDWKNSSVYPTNTGSASNQGGIDLMAGGGLAIEKFYVSGRVYEDNNNNQAFDSTEPTLKNIKVTLLDNNGNPIKSMDTTNEGRYTFTNLANGTYRIRVDNIDTDLPAGDTLTTPNDLTVNIVDGAVTQQNFGFRQATPSTLTADKSVALVVDSDKSGGATPLASQTPTPGDILEYTIAITNTSATTNANNVVLKDAIPTNTTYVPSTLQISTGANSGAKTDASADDQAEISGSQITFRLGTGATAIAGGALGTTAADKSTTVKFRVQINDPLPNGVATVSNQAIVSSTGVANVNSNDPSTPAAADPTVTTIGPRLRLVKRITGVTKAAAGSTKQTVGGYNDLATDPNDNASGWAGGSAAYLLGAITGSQIPAPNPGVPAPKDEVEYTIYFLSDGAGTAQNASICDFVPVNQSYVPGSLQLNFNGTTTAIADGSGVGPSSGFYTANFPTACQGTNNNKGAAYFQIGNVTSVNATPASSYGFVRFRAKVD
ncbi:MAG: DUF11 domain-containing protein [Myxacorys chilensis ATA2-1-KO14]|jgi:uncharacterized repeat protein (TIGR01451 family)|nr:DUF11 domain-containing protein [Myxacorys chilensis ATA2-1-KO14]